MTTENMSDRELLVHGETKAAYVIGAASRANAGPEPGDMPIDRLINSLPLPTYPLAPIETIAKEQK